MDSKSVDFCNSFMSKGKVSYDCGVVEKAADGAMKKSVSKKVVVDDKKPSLEDFSKVRVNKVNLGKRLLLDKNYPNDCVLDKVAGSLLSNGDGV